MAPKPAHQWDNDAPAARSGSVTLSGFSPNILYSAEWCNTYPGTIVTIQSMVADGSGKPVLRISGFTSDTAVNIGNTPGLTARAYLPLLNTPSRGAGQ